MLTGWEEGRRVKQLVFIYLVGSEKYVILSEVKKILDNANVSITEKLHRRKALSETFLVQFS